MGQVVTIGLDLAKSVFFQGHPAMQTLHHLSGTRPPPRAP